MKHKGAVLFWTDVANLVAFGGLLMTGALLKWILPHGGEGAGHGERRGMATDPWLGLSRHEWGDVHFWISVVVIGLLVFHLALHAGWIFSATRRYLFGWMQRPWKESTTSRLA